MDSARNGGPQIAPAFVIRRRVQMPNALPRGIDQVIGLRELECDVLVGRQMENGAECRFNLLNDADAGK